MVKTLELAISKAAALPDAAQALFLALMRAAVLTFAEVRKTETVQSGSNDSPNAVAISALLSS